MTKATRPKLERSARASPSTATRSAYLPDANDPTRSSQPMLRAASMVADLERLHGRHPVTHHVGELLRVVAVRVDPAVRAVGEAHPGRHRLAEPLPLGLGRLLLLAQELLRPALAPSLARDVVAVVDVRHQVHAPLLHQADGLVVH